MKVYKVQVTIKSIEGECPQEFKVGQSWLIDGKTPAGMCMGAYNSISPAVRVFRFGGEHPWDEDKDVTYISCPDPKNRVIYELKRLREEN